MSPDMKSFELDRIKNMLLSFGWSVQSSRFMGDKVQATFGKILASGQEGLGQIEMDRVVNLVKSFGWSQLSSTSAGGKLSVEFEKEIVQG